MVAPNALTEPLLPDAAAVQTSAPSAAAPVPHVVPDTTPPGFDWTAADALIEKRTPGYRCPPHDPDPDDEIVVDSLLGLTYREYEKRREYCALIFYLIGIIFLCFICFANRVDFIALRSNYFVQQSILQISNYNQFTAIKSYDDYYDWLGGAVTNTFRITPGNRTTPIGFALIRQLRIQTDSSCQDSTIKKFGFLGSARCVRESQRMTASFPANGFLPDPTSVFANRSLAALDLDKQTFDIYTTKWLSNRDNSDAVKASDVDGIFTGLAYPDDQFEVRLPYYSIDPSVNRSEQALEVVKTLRVNGFFDSNTAAIGVDMLYFHPTLTRYSMVTFMVEQLPSGLLYPSYMGSTFKLVKLGGTVANITLACDVFIFLFLIFQVLELAHRIYKRYGILGTMLRAVMANQHVLSLASIGCFLAVMVYRVWLWSIFQSMQFSPAPASELTYAKVAAAQAEMMRNMSNASAKGETSYQWFAVALIPLALKVLLYFKDVKGFNVIHKTLLHGRRDLLTVFCVVFAGIAFFALSGNVFFGGVDATFLTATVSFATLVRELVSADPGLVTNLVNLEPRVGSLYFGLFFVSMWLVLLNFVLGIIVSGVTTAVGEMNDVSSANSESVTEVIKKYYFLRSTEFKSIQPASRCKYCAQSAARPVLPGYFSRLSKSLQHQTTLYLVVKQVKEYSDRYPTIKRRVAEEEILRRLNTIDPKMKSRLFDAALEDVSAQVAATNAMERGTLALSRRIEELYALARDLEGRSGEGNGNDGDGEAEANSRIFTQSPRASTYGASLHAMSGYSTAGGSSLIASGSSLNHHSAGGLTRQPRFNLRGRRHQGI